MKTGRGKRVALVTVAVGVVVVIATGLALKDRIREEYWLWQLEQGDQATSKLAAERLGELRSVRAVPRLIEVLADVAPRHFEIRRDGLLAFSSWPAIERRSREVLRQKEAREWDLNWPGKALAAIGSPSVPALLEAVRMVPFTAPVSDPWAEINHPERVAFRDWCRETLARIGSGAIRDLEAACLDSEPVVRLVGTQALAKIREDHNAAWR